MGCAACMWLCRAYVHNNPLHDLIGHIVGTFVQGLHHGGGRQPMCDPEGCSTVWGAVGGGEPPPPSEGGGAPPPLR